MKISRTTKISRQKVPNLLSLSEKQKDNQVIWPKFFSKIQNSLKLLEEPIERLQEPTPRKLQSLNKRFASMHLQSLALPREKNSKFPHNTSYASTINNNSQATINPSTHATLPKMIPQPQLKRKTRSLHKPSYSLHVDTNYQSHQRRSSDYQPKLNDEMQLIATTKIDCERFDEIYGRKEGFLKLQMESIEVESENEEESEVKVESKIKQEDKLGKIKEFAADKDKLKEFSIHIINGEERKYDAFDKKLMEKIKIYRPRRIKLEHKGEWR